MQDCPEGRLAWIPKQDVLNLPLWEGDKVFLPLLLTAETPFSIKLTYHGDDLIDCKFF